VSTTYVDAQDAKRVLKVVDTMTGDLFLSDLRRSDLGTSRAFTFYVGLPNNAITLANSGTAPTIGMYSTNGNRF
jgi:hypothetical protein